ncbi:acyltransferase [Butyrivibrio fibrisolvens]|uniref:acyltransferase n=1 Tax=Pseudobutyrivibrio ruminis TaxID=46206 RepID=UPI00047F526E|nr:acyltransferase [Pseudobutyrivibrio ruminis]MDC7278853.1 acyltransferase [Butyrivibrio fibrisolvens]
MGIIKKLYRIVRYCFLYTFMYRKMESCGRHTVIIKPLRVHGSKNISVGDYTYICQGLRIEAIDSFANEKFTPHISIGNKVEMGQNCHISCVDNIVIEDDVIFGPNVMVNDSTHGYRQPDEPIGRQPLTHAPIKIGKGTLVGNGAIILPGVTIGEYSFIGGGCIIAKDVPAHTVVSNHQNLVMKAIN